MIESIHLENWQIHEDLKLELEPITVLVGDNGSGKSAVLRALEFVSNNQWEGEKNDHVTLGKEVSKITVVADGNTVIREKGKETNTYTLNESVFSAFHPGMPKEIIQTLKLGRENFQRQRDPAFWMLMTGGQAAAALNEIFCLEAIDQTLGNASKNTKEAKARVKFIEERLEQAQEQAKTLKWVEGAHNDLQQLEEIQQKIKDAKKEKEALLSCAESIKKMTKVREQIEKEEEEITLMIQMGEQCIEAQREIDTLQSIQELQVRKCNLAKTLKSKEERLEKWMSGMCPLCGRR